MIRRKNQNKEIQNTHNNITVSQKATYNNKFNYHVNNFTQDNESVLNKTALTQKSDDKHQNYSRQQTNKQNHRQTKKDESLLRRTYDYQNQIETFENFELKKHTNCEADFYGDKLNFRNVSRSPLGQRNNKQTQLADHLNNLKMEDNTTRKFDHVSFRQKKEMLRTSRYNMVENKAPTEDELQAKYQELWNYNQDIKNKSFRIDNNQQYQSAPFSNYRPQDVIINTRGRIDSLKQQQKELREYSSIKKHRNDSAHSQISHRNDSSSFIKERVSQDHCKTKKTSPQKRQQQGFSQIYTHEQKLLRTPQQPHFPLPHSIPIRPEESYHQKNTDKKLKIVQDFSSKISMRIKQLKISMQQMRINRR